MTIAALTAYGSQIPAAPRHANAQAWKTAQDFESSFLSTMTQTMFEGIKTDGVFGGGQGEEMFRSLMIDKYADGLVQQGGFGLAASIKAQMLKMQEAA